MNKGDFLEIEYVGKIKESGEIFDLTDEKLAKETNIYNPNFKYGPIVIIVGGGQTIKGVDEQLEKSDVGKNYEFDIPAEKAFGNRSSELLKTFQMSDFEKQRISPVAGQFLTFQNGVKGKIVSVSSGRVKVDFNHPLAGKVLHYNLKVNRKVTDQKEQIDAIMTFYFGSKNKPDIKVAESKATIETPEGVKMPERLKNAITQEITKYVTGIKEVNFLESAKKTQ